MDLQRSLIHSQRGFTLTEVVVASLILSVAVLPLLNYVLRSSRHATRENARLESHDALRRAFTEVDWDFSGMTEVTEASENKIVFRSDASRAPGYNPGAPSIDPTLTQDLNPDDDGDMAAFESPSQAFRRTGDDLHDDDDNGDGRVDLQCRYSLSGGALLREVNVNESGWTGRPVMTGGTVLLFSYRGSREERPGLDVGADGIPASGDTGAGEADGMIEALEIDARVGVGNQNGRLDTFEEREAVSSIQVFLSQDANGDGRSDAEMEMEFSPVFLPLKRIN